MTYQEIIKSFLHHCQYEYGVELSKYDPTTGDIIDVDTLIESWVYTKRKVANMESDWIWLDVTKAAKLFMNNPEELKSYHVRVKKEKRRVTWQPIETLDKTIESFDLYGWISYDCIETRLTDCDYVNGKFRYLQAGEMLDIDTIGFTPTHWMVVQPPEEKEE